MCSAADLARLNSLLRRAKRLNYCTDDLPLIAELFSNADDNFFHTLGVELLFSELAFTGGPDAKILFLSTQRPPTAQKI